MTLAPGEPLNMFLEKNPEKYDQIGPKITDLSTRSLEEAVFRSGYFHADLHFGNIYYSEELNRLTLIDFGRIGHLSSSEQPLPFQLGIAVYFKSKKILFRVLKRFAKKTGSSFDDWDLLKKLINDVLDVKEGEEASVPGAIGNLVSQCAEKGLRLTDNLTSFVASILPLLTKASGYQMRLMKQQSLSEPQNGKKNGSVWKLVWAGLSKLHKVGYWALRMFI